MQKQPVMINDIAFSALIESTETLSADVPQYPTEENFSISDSIIIKPRELSMTLFVTNTAVTWPEHNSPSRVQDVITQLKALYFKREPVTVTTMRGVNRNMAITGIELSNTLENGTSREIPISFQELRIAASQTTTIPDSYGRGGATGVNAGAANTKAATVAADEKPAEDGAGRGSILYNIAGSLGIVDSGSSGSGLGGLLGGMFGGG